MATSSFSKEFVIDDPKSVELLIDALENPVEIKLVKRDPIKEEERKKEILCKLEKRLASLNL